jgi:diguanylate cyclase (GGDEF)-like protein
VDYSLAAQEEEVRAGALKSLSVEEVEKLAMLSAVSRSLNSTQDMHAGLHSVLGELLTALNGDRGFVQLLGPGGEFAQEVSIDRSTMPHGTTFKYSRTMFQKCLSERKPVLMLDVDGGSASDSVVLTGIRSVMIHPLLSQEQMVGVLYLDSMVKAGRFLETDLQLLGIIADMVTVFLERSASAAALENKQEELRKANRLLAESAQETIYKLSRAAEFRDDEGGEHVQRVSHYCEAIALHMGMSRAVAGRLKMASQLHDVGKVGIPDSILLKPGRFTEYEREVMKQHTIIGAKILSGSNSPVISLAAEVALTHHEKWDGTGYPKGLAGDKIPISGRIVAVADVFDALTTERRYKAAWTLDRAMELISQEGGSHFDPEVSKAFVALRDKVEEIRARYQPSAEPEPEVESEVELVLQTRAQGRELLAPMQKAIEALARGEEFSYERRSEALHSARRLTGLLGSLGAGLDPIRRLGGHFKRPDLLSEQAPRLAALLAEVEAALSEEPSTQVDHGVNTILLVDPDPYQRETLVIEAFNRGLTTVEAKDIPAARQAVQMRVPEMLILEVAQAETDEFLDWFCQEHPSVPLVVLSSEGVFSKRLDVARRGGAVYLHKPMPASAVFDAIEERLARHDQRVYRVLALDDDPISLKVLGRSLSSQGFQTQILSDPLKLWYALAETPPDIFLLDWEMPLVSGVDIVKVLRSDPHHARLPIIVLTSHEDTETYQRALEAGADDVLCKPLDAARLGSRILNRLGRDTAVRKSSARDPLTGLMDVQSALRTAAHLFALAVRNGAPFSLCLLKLERFEEMGEVWGRPRAAEVLRRVALVLERRSRPEDIVVHYRDDCFLLGLYGSPPDATDKLLVSLNARLAQENFNVDDGSFVVRCKAFTACYPEDGTLLQDLLDKVNSTMAAG